MNRSFAALFLPVEYQDSENRTKSLLQIYADWDKLKVYISERVLEAHDVA